MNRPATDEPTERWPVQHDRTIELVREAFIQAMQDQGVSPRTRFTISARAELKIHEALEYDAEEADQERAQNRQLAQDPPSAVLQPDL